MPRNERRKGKREPAKIPVVYGAVDAFFTDFASNINEGGMFIETDSPADLGELVQVVFTFPSIEEQIQVGARVAWISDGKDESPPGMGVEFLDLASETRQAINVAVRKLRV